MMRTGAFSLDVDWSRLLATMLLAVFAAACAACSGPAAVQSTARLLDISVVKKQAVAVDSVDHLEARLRLTKDAPRLTLHLERSGKIYSLTNEHHGMLGDCRADVPLQKLDGSPLDPGEYCLVVQAFTDKGTIHGSSRCAVEIRSGAHRFETTDCRSQGPRDVCKLP